MKKGFYCGILLIFILSLVAWGIAEIPAVKMLSFSSLIVGILLGMIYANTLRSKQPAEWDGGMKFCSKRILRLGIILYGFRLTFQDVVEVGMPALAVDTIIVTCTLLLGVWVGKNLGIDKETTIMTSTGSAICGAAAVLGVEPIVKGEAHKTAVAVSTVVIFGTISMFLYPILYSSGCYAGLTDSQIGIYTGSTLHEVAHVVGAGNAMAYASGDWMIANSSLIVKMVRVILLVPALLIISALLTRGSASSEKSKLTVPWFAIIFLVVIGVNSLLCSSFGGELWYAHLKMVVQIVSTFMLTMAMTALGADTSIDKFKQAGAKPFLLAGILYVWLVGGGYLLARFFVPLFS